MKLTKKYLDTLNPERKREEIFFEYLKCKNDLRYCIETYFTVLSGTKRIPFILFPHQVDTLNAFEEFTNCISMKSRQMGLTTFTAAYLSTLVIFNNNHKCLIISKTLTDSKDFLKIVKDTLNDARANYPWLIPNYQKGYDNKESFILTTGSSVKAS